MRYLCLIGASYAVATFCCAYWLPNAWLLPLAAGLMGFGLLCVLLRRWLPRRWLARVTLCLLSVSLALGAYAHHWATHVAPAQALDGQTVAVTLELRAAPAATAYGYSVPAWMVLSDEQYSVLCYLDADGGWLPGDRLTGQFRLRLPSDEADATLEPGYLRSTGIYLTASPAGAFTAARPSTLPLRHWPAMLRERIATACEALFSDETAPWFIALLTNQNGGIAYADKNDLKLAGLYHCLCTSGMHINVLLGLVSVLCLRRRRLAAMIGLPVCMFFWAVAGGTPSVSRAVVMQAVLLLAPLLQQEEDAPTSMAAALLLILIRRPDSIAHLGLQLSFLSVGGILLFAPRIYSWAVRQPLAVVMSRHRGWKWLLQGLISSLSTALGALLLTTPLLAWHYGVVSLIAPLSGLVTLPVVTVCFALGLPVTLLGSVCPSVAAMLAPPLEWLMRYLMAVTRLAADVPGGALYISSPYWAVWLFLAYGFLLLLWIGHARPQVPVLCILLSYLLTLGVHTLDVRRAIPAEGFRLTVLDVGQGQCLVLRMGDATCVIDCGGSWPEDAGETCARYLLGQGIRRIDLLALTHYHADHAGGVPQLLSRVPANTLLLPEVADGSETRAAIQDAARSSEILWITEDTTLPLGCGELTAYAPRSLAGDNEACLAFLASQGSDDLLVTGDMDWLTEILLCKSAHLPDIEIFIAGHHGSRESNSAVLLERTAPEVVVVSAADRYGHPHAEALERFAAAGAVVLNTAELGNITIER